MSNQKGGLELQALVHSKRDLEMQGRRVGVREFGVACLGLGGCGHLSQDGAAFWSSVDEEYCHRGEGGSGEDGWERRGG